MLMLLWCSRLTVVFVFSKGTLVEAEANTSSRTNDSAVYSLEGKQRSGKDLPTLNSTSESDSAVYALEGKQRSGKDVPTLNSTSESDARPYNAVLDADQLGNATVSNITDASPARILSDLYFQTPITSWPDIALVAGGNGKGALATQLNYPYGGFFVPEAGALNGEGHLYVSDTQNHRVQRWPVGIAGVPATVAGGAGPGRGLHQLRFPKGIFVDGSLNLFVADSGNHRVMRYADGATSGVVVAGSPGIRLNKHEVPIGVTPYCCFPGRKSGQLQNPHGVYVDSGLIYVADTGNNRVQRWNGQIVTTVAGGSSQNVNATLNRPEGVFVWKTGDLYVADTGNDRVMLWSQSATVGVLVGGGRGRGSALDQLISPTSILVNDDLQEDGLDVNQLYVCDTFNDRVVKYRLPGAWTHKPPALVAGGCLQNPPYVIPCPGGGLHYPLRTSPDRIDARARNVIINPSRFNPPVYYFWGPSSVMVSGDGRNITVIDTANHRVLTWIDYR